MVSYDVDWDQGHGTGTGTETLPQDKTWLTLANPFFDFEDFRAMFSFEIDLDRSQRSTRRSVTDFEKQVYTNKMGGAVRNQKRRLHIATFIAVQNRKLVQRISNSVRFGSFVHPYMQNELDFLLDTYNFKVFT